MIEEHHIMPDVLHVSDVSLLVHVWTLDQREHSDREETF